jgi:hypothetical protein
LLQQQYIHIEQGDQIGRFFAHKVIVYLGQFIENSKIGNILGLLFFTIKALQ